MKSARWVSWSSGVSAATVLLVGGGACTTGGEHAATTVGTSVPDAANDTAPDGATAPGDTDRPGDL